MSFTLLNARSRNAGQREWATPDTDASRAESLDEALCTGSNDWDLDFGSPTQWIAAMTKCHACPMLDTCREQLDLLYPQWWTRMNESSPKNPAGVIWAGWAFSDAGTVLTEKGLVRAASERRSRRRAEENAQLGVAS